MSESTTIEKTIQLNTTESLKNDFQQLGVRAGMNLIVHSSLSSIGYVSGGAVAVVKALMQVITEEGTIVMPTHTSNNSDPSGWGNPPVPEEWWPIMRETMPAFHPNYTPTRGMGQIVEVFRTMPQVYRSEHPTYSFAAWGKFAKWMTENQPIDNPMGEGSPLTKMYDLASYILLLGVDYDSSTSMHLAEYRQKQINTMQEGAAMERNGQREWKVYQNIEFVTELFPRIGLDFEAENEILRGKVGMSECRLISQKDCVDFTIQWLNQNN